MVNSQKDSICTKREPATADSSEGQTEMRKYNSVTTEIMELPLLYTSPTSPRNRVSPDQEVEPVRE